MDTPILRVCRFPTVFSSTVHAALSSLVLLDGCILLQYVDNILLFARDHNVCTQGSQPLLKHLVHCGFKASLSKLQFCQPLVHYLGLLISQGERCPSSDCLRVIVKVSPSTTQKVMLSFLGLINYCRQYIPYCSHHDTLLRQRRLRVSLTLLNELRRRCCTLSVILNKP